MWKSHKFVDMVAKIDFQDVDEKGMESLQDLKIMKHSMLSEKIVK